MRIYLKCHNTRDSVILLNIQIFKINTKFKNPSNVIGQYKIYYVILSKYLRTRYTYLAFSRINKWTIKSYNKNCH